MIFKVLLLAPLPLGEEIKQKHIPMKSILITGANGLLGSHLCDVFYLMGWNVFPVTRRYIPDFPVQHFAIDFHNPTNFSKFLLTHRPNIVLHSSANSNASECEKNPDDALFSNVTVTKIIAETCSEFSVPLAFISSDLVFDGKKGNYTETDEPNPQHIYGKTKLDAELFIQKTNKKQWIFRTALLIGKSYSGQNGFLDGFISTIKSCNTFYAITDEFRTPLSVRQTAKLIEKSISLEIAYGLYHLSSDEKLNRYQIALQLAEKFDLDSSLILKSKLSEFKGSPKRQPDVSMNNGKLKDALGIEAIGSFLDDVDAKLFK